MNRQQQVLQQELLACVKASLRDSASVDEQVESWLVRNVARLMMIGRKRCDEILLAVGDEAGVDLSRWLKYKDSAR